MKGMSETKNSNPKLTAIRGATTAKGNKDYLIRDVVIELIQELITRNHLKEEDIISITFTVTEDLNSCFPASIARKHFNFDSVAFLDCQQMFVPNDVNFCIRLLALVYLEYDRQPINPYLNESYKLRPDR